MTIENLRVPVRLRCDVACGMWLVALETQSFYDEDDSSTESELAAEIKRVFSPMYYERKRKRDEMENDEDDNDA